jgi:hypothetical protein
LIYTGGERDKKLENKIQLEIKARATSALRAVELQHRTRPQRKRGNEAEEKVCSFRHILSKLEAEKSKNNNVVPM